MQQLKYLFNCSGCIDLSVFCHDWKKKKDQLTIVGKKHTHNDNWSIKTKGRSFEHYKSISLLTILFFVFFISLVGRFRNQIGVILIERSDIKNQRLSTIQEKRGASRQTNKKNQTGIRTRLKGMCHGCWCCLVHFVNIVSYPFLWGMGFNNVTEVITL